MWKWVVRDYFAAFRWEKSKEWFKNGWWSILYFGIFMPMIAQLFEKPKHVVIYMCIVLPVLFAVVSDGCHTMALPKVMYLCPMTNAQRRDYVEKSCIFRMGFVSLIGMAGALIPLMVGIYGGVEAGLVMFDSFALAVTFCGFDRIKIDDKTKERFNQNTAKYPMRMSGMIETFALIVNLCSIMGMVMYFCWDTTTVWWVKWIFVGSAVLIQLPLTIRLLKNWNKTMERAASYEESFL